jgi:hypothetical protein
VSKRRFQCLDAADTAGYAPDMWQTRRHVAWKRLALLSSALALVACAPGAAGASGALAGVVLFVSVLALMAPSRRAVPAAQAGAPAPCSGWESRGCEGGSIQTRCCPEGAKCNFRDEPYLECGHGLCTTSGDLGRCPSPKPALFSSGAGPGGEDEAACRKSHGSWERACANKVVVAVCMPPMPTNYMGPGMNPPFKVCGKGQRLVSAEPAVGERCTTHVLAEDCYPTKKALGADKCLGGWQKVCLGGQVEERCLPVSLTPKSWHATTFVSCDDGSCAVGEDKTKVCRP